MLIKIEDLSIMLGKKPVIIPGLENSDGESTIFLAGGCIRRWFSGQTQDSDVDVFFKTKEALDNYHIPSEFKFVFETNNAKTYKYKGSLIQFIKVITGSIEEVFSKFDFHHCCFAYDGSCIYSTDLAIITTLRKHLAINNIQTGFEVDSLRRAFKYQLQGFTPCLGTLKDLVSSFKSVDGESLDKQIEISPGGSLRVIRFD